MAGKSSDTKVRCSFCNKTQDQVRKMIAGPTGVYICDECVDLCADIIEEEYEEEESTNAVDINLLKPVEIKEFLDDYVHMYQHNTPLYHLPDLSQILPV